MTGAYTFDDSRSQFGSRAAIAVAVFAAVVLGVGAGYPSQTALGILGGLLFGISAPKIESEQLRDRVRGSVMLLGAAVLVVVAVVAPKATPGAAILVSMLPAAVGATTLAGTTTIEDAGFPVLSALGRTFLVTLAGTILAGALYANVFSSLAGAAWGAYGLGVRNIPLFGFVALQFELLAIGLLVGKAGRAAAELNAREQAGSESPMGVRDVPLGLWALLAVQVLVLSLPGGAALFEAVILIPGLIGLVLEAVLTSIVLHAALLGLAGLLALLPGVQIARNLTVRVVGNRPPKSFAYAAGGFAFVCTVIVLTSIPGVVSLVRWLAQGSDVAISSFDTYGVAPAVLGSLTGVLALTAIFLFVFLAITGLSVVPDTAPWFALAGVTLFVASCAAALTNAPAPAVFVGMASAFLVWDFGEYGTIIGAELGRTATSRSPEVSHALASLGVAGLAVAVASVATHFLVPLMAGLSSERASTALGLLAISIVAFAYLAYTASDSPE